MQHLPESILQFGGGNFLRGFADLFVHQANMRGQAVGRIVVLQSTDSHRADLLNKRKGLYHVLERGLRGGVFLERVHEVSSISRALIAKTQWRAVLRYATDEHLRYIISNTTEAGFALQDEGYTEAATPASFPAKLLRVLHARFQAGLPGLDILPCELIENNADRLRSLILTQARRWRMPEALMAWIREECRWRNTLVDRIVSGQPQGHPLLATDPLLTAVEPFAQWILQTRRGAGPVFRHECIKETDNLQPFYLRKVRILNAAHTALVEKAMPMGIQTVRDAMLHDVTGPWLKELLHDEIIPILRDRVDEAEEFARQTMERFLNPCLDHKLESIAMHHASKIKVRLFPTYVEFREQFGREPRLLRDILSPYLASMDARA